MRNDRGHVTTAVLAAAVVVCSIPLTGCGPVTTVVRCSLTAILDSGEPGPQPPDTHTVRAAAETVPVDDPCDAADDPAIWVNEADPEASLIVASNKIRGLLVHTLDGRIVSRLDINNVDLRAGIRVGAEETIVVAGTNRTTKTLDILALDPGNGKQKRDGHVKRDPHF